ncbi:hypothetical protein AAG906_004027 [Vitis piasezkii]
MKGTSHIYKPSHEEEDDGGNLLIPSKSPTVSYISSPPWLTKSSEGASGHLHGRLLRCNSGSRTLVCWDCVSIHPAIRGSPEREPTTLAPSGKVLAIFSFDSIIGKDGHTFPKPIIR